MNEKLLQYLWNYKIFRNFDFKDVDGNPVEILDFGKWNHDSGPDFLNAKIKTGSIVFAGNIELHVKSSDWIFHNHSSDQNFDNVILHAVYQHDTELEDFQKKKIPTLQLYDYIDQNILKKYQFLLQENSFIACEKIFDAERIPVDFVEETLLKKLDEKSLDAEIRLKNSKNDAEAVLFQQIAYAFGLKVNAEIFKNIAENINFSIIRKISQSRVQLEALLFGTAGWLEETPDEQTKIWKREYEFLKTKYQLPETKFRPKFLRLRPPNFPTLRLSQLAHLYHREQNLFSKISKGKSADEIHEIFDGIHASEYWNCHFNFGTESKEIYQKTLTKDFVELILTNAILPLKYTFGKNQNEENAEDILKYYEMLPSEKNTVVERWKNLGAKIRTAADSQAFIWHYKNRCKPKNCLNCSIGFRLLKENS